VKRKIKRKKQRKRRQRRIRQRKRRKRIRLRLQRCRLAHQLCSSLRRTKTNSSNTSTRHQLTVSPSEVTMMIKRHRRLEISQSTHLRTVLLRSSHTVSVIMLGMMSSTRNHPSLHGRHLRQTVCHFRIRMHSGVRIQFIHLRTAPPKSCHTTSATTPGTMSNTITHLRKAGRLPRQLACHCLAPTPKIPSQPTQL